MAQITVQHGSVLILYLYTDTPERVESKGVRDNLRFFVRHGMSPEPRFQFRVLATREGPHLPGVTLPRWPNVRVHWLNQSYGFEFGNFRHALLDPALEMQRFTYFVMLADTVRGPFLPNYVPASSWLDHLTGLLSAEVKLVGPSINCYYW